MATSGSVSVQVTNHDTLKFTWELSSQSVAGNTSSVKWKMELIASGAGAISSKTQKDWKVTVNGTEYSGKNSIAIGNNKTITLASGSTTIKHNDDGTKAFSFSFQQDFSITFAGSWIGTKFGSGNGTLTTIARLSTLTVSNGTLGTEMTLAVNRESTSFSHRIAYTCGDTSGVILEKGTDTSIRWTPPLELAQQNPTGESVSITFYIHTYASSPDNIGGRTASITCAIPANLKPPIMPTITDGNGYGDYYGSYIQGKSKLLVNINTYGVYGSWIKSYRVTVDGKTYTQGQVDGNYILVETDTVNGSGDLPLTISVTDSRERTTTDECTIQVLEYKAPSITSLSTYRSDENGNSVPDGDHLTVKFSSYIYALNSKNGAWYKVCYKKAGEATEHIISIDTLAGTYSVQNGTYTFAADPQSYDIILKVGDRFSTTPRSAVGEAVQKVFSLLKKNGEIVGIAFNKIAEHEGVVDINWQLKISGDGDSVIEEGTISGTGTTKDGWTYRKWDSGIMECWKTVTYTTDITNQWGGIYISPIATERQSYPVPFISKPVENVSVQGNAPVMLITASTGNGVNGAWASARYHVCCPGSQESLEYYLSFHVIGRWKESG